MALLTSCLCCNLLLGAIVSGVYVTMVYLLAFLVSLWWIIDEESKSELNLPAPAYVLCVCYLLIAVTTAWMLLGLYKKRTSVLLGWVFMMMLFSVPEMGMVAFMTFIHRKLTSARGLTDLIFYIFRAAFNLMSVLCVHSQYSIWKDARTTSHTLKSLQNAHMKRTENNCRPEEDERGGGRGEIEIVYQNPAFSVMQEAPSRPIMTRSLSRGTSLRGWNRDMNNTAAGLMSRGMPSVYAQVRTGLPGWDPYINRESHSQSQSEFNAATFTPASVGFMPLARSELALYPPSPPSPTPSLTVYHHSPPLPLYPLHLPHLSSHLPVPLSMGDPLAYPVGTQSLDRRRYVRKWQGSRDGSRSSMNGGINNVMMNGSSKSSLGAGSDDFRKYRDVAL